jgi:DNA-binding response OmpR family regulator
MDKKKILVIDDEVSIAEVLKIRLEAAGYQVELAFDGEEGLNKARTVKPDLIILDIMLPKMNGYEICRMLKYDKNFMKIPIIMLTAKVREADKKMGKEVGTNAYIEKPFEPEVLLEKINNLLK